MNTIIFQGFRGVQYFSGGVQHFEGGVQLFLGGLNANLYRKPSKLWFSRGGGGPDPYPPSGSAHVKPSVMLIVNLIMLKTQVQTCLFHTFASVFAFIYYFAVRKHPNFPVRDWLKESLTLLGSLHHSRFGFSLEWLKEHSQLTRLQLYSIIVASEKNVALKWL